MCCQNHIVEVPASSNKKWMKNKKKSGGKKSKKKGPVTKGGAPVKKPSIANNVASTDNVERRDTKPAGQNATPTNSVMGNIMFLLYVHAMSPSIAVTVIVFTHADGSHGDRVSTGVCFSARYLKNQCS